MRIIGLDISTKTGLATGADGQVDFSTMITHPPTEDRYSRWFQYSTDILSYCKGADVVFVEGYGFANKHTLVPLVELSAVIKAGLRVRGVPFIEVPPTSLKKFVTGKGVMKKSGMLLEVYKRWGFDTLDDNIADAFALLMFGYAFTGILEDMPRANMSAVHAVQNSHKKMYGRLVKVCNLTNETAV